MLLKSLKLDDFRQFKGTQMVEFSTDPKRNVTIMKGENGSGKTSFAQAFRWCLYGDTDFQDTILLSRALSQTMPPNSDDDVWVEIVLMHNDTEYTIKRWQKYKKDGSGKIVPVGQSKLTFSYVKDGNVVPVDELVAPLRISEILPKGLSRYFFFDGERLDKMAKEISAGRSQEFGEAVRNLLGLDASLAALEHLKRVSRNYTNSLNSDADTEIAEISKRITSLDDEINNINDRLEQLEGMELAAQDKANELTARIAKNKDSENLAKEKENLKKMLGGLESSKKDAIKSLILAFGKSAYKYFPKKMMKDALTALKNADQLDKGIPDIHARTIDFLIKRGECICGGKVETGNEIFNALNKLRDYIPPKSLGNLISDFTNICEMSINSTESFKTDFDRNFKIVRDFENNRNETEQRLKDVEKRLEGMESVGSLQADLKSYEKYLSDYKEERSMKDQRKGVCVNEKETLEQKLQELLNRGGKNTKIKKYMAYTEYIYKDLKEQYDIEETTTREKLATTINKIFQSIYAGGFSLSLDHKYNVILSADGYVKAEGDNIETSTAQGISIIFAFIAGVIQMAKDGQSEDSGIASNEPYPLVMDAPLSAFDKTRIETVCEVLPKIAQQVIIFIKDTDGDIADKHLGSRIGKRYEFAKLNPFETNLIEAGK